MKTFKKLLAGTVLIYVAHSAAASANELNVELNLGQPAAVYAPPPPPPPPVAYVSPAYVSAPWVEGYDPHHRHHDWRYWHDHHDHRFDHDHDHYHDHGPERWDHH